MSRCHVSTEPTRLDVVSRTLGVSKVAYTRMEFALAFGFTSTETVQHHYRRLGRLPATRSEAEVFAAGLRPSSIGKAALARIQRAQQRERSRAEAASILLAAETAKRPQRNYSKMQAALSRIANGEVPCELPPDKRTLRRKRKVDGGGGG